MAPNKGVNAGGRTQLMLASERGDAAKVLQILQDDFLELEKEDNGGVRALHLAAAKKRSNIVKLLLDHHASPDCSSNQSDTPLTDAMHSGDADGVLYLLAAGANPWLKDGWYHMPADYVENVAKERQDEVKAALLHSADLRLREKKPDERENHLPARAVAQLDSHYTKDLRDVAVMANACLVGDLRLLNDMVAARTIPTSECAEAAAKGGHLQILRRILTLVEPNPTQLSELMSITMGRGNLEVVKYLLSLEGFNVKTKVDDQHLHLAAKGRKGPRMFEEYRILQHAFKAGGRSGLTEEAESMNVGSSRDHARQMEQIAENEEEEEGQEKPAKRRRLITGAQREEELEQERAKDREARLAELPDLVKPPHSPQEEQDLQQGSARTRVRASSSLSSLTYSSEEEADLEQKSARTREATLVAMPYALRAAIEPPHVPTNADLANVPSNLRFWRRTLNQVTGNNVMEWRERRAIDPEAPQEKGKDKYTLNVYAAFFLRQTSLDESKSIAGMEWLPIDAVTRTTLINNLPFLHHLTKDELWLHAPKELLATGPPRPCPHDYSIQEDRDVGNVLINGKKAQEWIKNATDDELYWIKVEALEAQFRRTPHMQGIKPLLDYEPMQDWPPRA